MAVFKFSFPALTRELNFTEEQILAANRGLCTLPATAPKYAQTPPEDWIEDMLSLFEWNGALVFTAASEAEQARVRDHGGTIIPLGLNEDPEEALEAFYCGDWPQFEPAAPYEPDLDEHIDNMRMHLRTIDRAFRCAPPAPEVQRAVLKAWVDLGGIEKKTKSITAS